MLQPSAALTAKAYRPYVSAASNRVVNVPLIKSASDKAFRSNVPTLMREIGKSPHVKSRDQALAIAYSIKRRNRARGGYADGGMPDDPVFASPQDIPAGMLPHGYLDPSARAAGQILAPNLTDYLTSPHSSDPHPQVLPSGKISNYDPALGKAYGDIPGLASLGLGGEGLAEGLAARAASAAPGIAERLAPSVSRLGSTIAGAGERLPIDMMGNATGTAMAMAPATAQASTAIEGPGERPTATPDEAKRIADINRQITDLGQKRAKATAGIGPKGAAIAAQPFDAQLGRLNEEISTINKQVTDRQNAWEVQKAEFDKTTAPFAERHPEGAAALRFAPLASVLSGAWVGRMAGASPTIAKRTAAYLAGGAGGGLEGLVGGYYPTLQDAGMPRGTAAKAEANANNADPDFWKYDIAPEVGMGAALGLLGTKYGMLSKGKVPAAALPAIKPSEIPEAAAAPAATGKAWPTNPKDIDMFRDSVGKWREQGTGHFVPKHLQPPAPTVRNGKIVPMQAAAGEARGGGVGDPAMHAAFAARRAVGGVAPLLSPGSLMRQEVHGMHQGPILSAVAGRTDHHPMSVAAGSYVLPADHISSLGQGNTANGMAVVNRMFGSGGPYGAGRNMPIRAGLGAPRAPKPMMATGGNASDKGGGRGGEGGIGHPVPINAAGGEYVIPPESVMRVGHGDIKRGHAVLDHWVVSNRKKHIKTLAKLPGPAKS